MLTQHHLAVLRAALKYFSEELLPHGQDVMRHYFDDAGDADVTTTEIQSLLRFLQWCELKYSLYDPATDRLNQTDLTSSVEPIKRMLNEYATSQIAVVLLGSQDVASTGS